MHTLSLGQTTREKLVCPAERGERSRRPLELAAGLDRPAVILLFQGCLSAASYGLASMLFARLRGLAWVIEALRSGAVPAVAFGLAASVSVRLYRRSARYACILDLIEVVKAVGLSSLVFAFFICLRFPSLNFPVALFVLQAMFLFVMWSGLLFGARILQVQNAAKRIPGKRAIVVGAGDAGIAVLKEISLDSTSARVPVAILDDNVQKRGRTLYGVRILGGTNQVAKIAAETRADEILICIPSATRTQMHDILDACRRSNLPVRSLPSIAEILDRTPSGIVSSHDLCSPRIEDLLQRERVEVDTAKARQLIRGKSVLVTGAGGSIGSELCRQIAAAGPRKLILLDKSENSLFYVHREAREQLNKAAVNPYLADLVERCHVTAILKQEQPDIVLHAAAHKHVGMLELHPGEAIRNNVIGARNIAAAALESGAARFVNISTDKAVNPCNYMGLSKKITELCIREFARLAGDRGTRFSNVRFGNVAGSTGSVLKLFWEQIQKGGPIRITDARATRYFMSVPEAVHLILRGAALARGGETFALDMGEPLNIYELARTMALFAGLKPHVDIAIEFTGLQAGEKTAEKLWEDWEYSIAAGSERLLEIRERSGNGREVLAKISRMETFLSANDTDGLLQYLDEAFPDFRANRERREETSNSVAIAGAA